MKWFGRKAAGRADARPQQRRGFATWMPDAIAPLSYAAQVRAAFHDNPVAQRAVRLVAQGAGAAPVVADSDAVMRLVQARSGGQPLLEAVAAHLLLNGNAYIQILCDADDAPVELFALRPDRVTIATDARGWPSAFVYRAGEAVTRIAAHDGQGRARVIHLKALDPTDDHYGAGCLGAASGAVAIHNAATRWNRALLDNAARPSGALVFEGGGTLAPDQFERLREQLAEAHMGTVNAGRPLLLEGGLKWQALSLTPSDMEFVALKEAAAREIALAFGVPPMLLGLPGDATYANYREANRAVWRLTILPLVRMMIDGLADALVQHWPDTRLRIDVDQIGALAEDRERLWAQVSAADFLSNAEKRVLLGLAPVEEGQ